LVSCGANDKKTGTTATPAASAEAAMPHHHDSAAAKKEVFTNVNFDAKKDFVCGMPISAGVEDTAHYKEKVYGFCSKECKDEFAKNPESFLAKK
jgi:YHS domain-containing protein